jgi:hypothetical protein
LIRERFQLGGAMLMVIGSLVGLLLGLRFKVAVFVPVILTALVFVYIDGLVHADGPSQIVLEMIAISTAAQLGYLGGCVLRLVTCRIFTHRQSKSSVPHMPSSPT